MCLLLPFFFSNKNRPVEFSETDESNKLDGRDATNNDAVVRKKDSSDNGIPYPPSDSDDESDLISNPNRAPVDDSDEDL
jgi:hypothetical protein